MPSSTLRQRAEETATEVFTEPWQPRAVAMAVETVEALGLTWDDFRAQLIAAIDDDPHRPYYESWLVALEAFALEHAGVDGAALAKERGTAAAYRTSESGVEDLEVFPIEVDGPRLTELLTWLFRDRWAGIRVGSSTDAARVGGRTTAAPTVSTRAGHLVVDAGTWSVEVDIAGCGHAELHRRWAEGVPVDWLFRMYDGDGHSQLTVVLPHPFLDDEGAVQPVPDWDRLATWDELRRRYLDLDPDPMDRAGEGFVPT